MTGINTTRQRLVEAALYLFWKNGYSATGMAEILARAKVKPGSLYYFFKTKEELLIAVLRLYVETLHPVVMDPVFAETDDPIERIFGVLGFYRRNLIATGCTYGCPIGRLALEIGEEQVEVHKLLSDNFDGWTAAVESCLKEAASRLPADLDTASLSRFVLTVMEGGVMQARAQRSLAPFDASVAHLRNYFQLLEEKRDLRAA
jgi:TetR/AcrR family transcriptional regulator, transcriptional repressor for nem operon